MSETATDIAIPRPLSALLVDLVAQRFRVLGQPMRVRLLDELDRRGEANVQTLADELSATQQNASRHLGVLAQAGLLARRQDGRVVWYRVASPEAFGLIETIAAEILDELRRLDSGE